jgi:hypothetical protein
MATAGINKEESDCPRCGRLFYCRAGDILNCECHGFKLDKAASGLISEKYGGCLCLQCLQDLNQQILLVEKPGSAK